MRTRISVALNGIELHSIDEAIVLQGVDEGSPSWNINAGNRANTIGQYVNSVEKKYRDVTVTFAIAEQRDLIRRHEILQQIFAWADKGGDLTVSYRDGQKLRVICTAMPAVKTLTKWAEIYSITFRAYEIPFWQSTDKTSVTIAATSSGNTTMRLRETGGGLLCFEATNSSGSTVNTLAVAANGRNFTFSGLGLANGEKLRGDYDDRGIQRIRIQATGGTWRSAMAARATISNDDILLNPGANTVYVSSGEAVSWQLYTYGRWL